MNKIDIRKENAGLSLPPVHCSSPLYSLFNMRKYVYPAATKSMLWEGNIDIWTGRKYCALFPGHYNEWKKRT